MCGIVGVSGGELSEAEEALERLMYRGYDSWGFASRYDRHREVGQFEGDAKIRGSSDFIGHTRWATHGEVTKKNTHPHGGCQNDIQVVHNGTITNHDQLREQLEARGHHFSSETDTEVIPHYIEEFGSLDSFAEAAEGDFAVLVLNRRTGELTALKQGSPLVYGKKEGTHYFASDIYAISDAVDEAYFMEDGDLISTMDDHDPEFQSFEWTESEPRLEDYQHWMEKEIYEQPEALRDLRDSLLTDQAATLQNFEDALEEYDTVLFTASGTSYHASLIGVYLLNQRGIEAQTLIASEFQNYERADEDTLLIAVSQSGETRDVLDAMRHARESGADVFSVTNVPHSTIERKSDRNLNIRAGQEICVAATKTFANQVYAMMHIAGMDDLQEIPRELDDRIPELHDVARVASRDLEFDYYIVGEGLTYPLAREIALKMKEISYVHAEGMMAGELKHGTLALITDGTPVLALPGDIDTTVSEVESRGGDVLRLSREDSDALLVFRAATFGFLMALEAARDRGLPVDRPRNLAKSVTVK